MEIKKFNRGFATLLKRMRGRALLALSDDARRDITSEACVRKNQRARALIVAGERGILCGISEARKVMEPLKVRERKREGSEVRRGEVILEIEGNVREILRRERTALDYISQLSGIATLSRELAEKFGKGRVGCTRKTHPCMGFSEKRAARIGGALTHRLSLADGYLIKDNHISAVARELGVPRTVAIMECVKRAFAHRKKSKNKFFIEVEVENLREGLAAARTRADAVLIDNKKPAAFAKIAKEIRKINRGIIIEASGGITPENAGEYLRAGADFVSMSYLLLRAKPLEVSLEIE